MSETVVALALVAILFALALILILATFLRREHQEQVKAMLDMAASFEVERRELLERIQRPERIPRRSDEPVPPRPTVDPERAANYARIGLVRPPAPPEEAS